MVIYMGDTKDFKHTYSIHEKDGFFYVAFNIEDKNGIRKHKYLSTGVKIGEGKRAYKASLLQAHEKAKEKILRTVNIEACSDIGIFDSNILFCDYLKNYVERRKDDVAPTTYDNDVHYLNKHIYSWFKKHKLKLIDVKPIHIEMYWKEKVKEGLSPNSALKHIRLMGPCFKDAVRNGFITSNPCEFAIKPKKEDAVPEPEPVQTTEPASATHVNPLDMFKRQEA